MYRPSTILGSAAGPGQSRSEQAQQSVPVTGIVGRRLHGGDLGLQLGHGSSEHITLRRERADLRVELLLFRRPRGHGRGVVPLCLGERRRQLGLLALEARALVIGLRQSLATAAADCTRSSASFATRSAPIVNVRTSSMRSNAAKKFLPRDAMSAAS